MKSALTEREGREGCCWLRTRSPAPGCGAGEACWALRTRSDELVGLERVALRGRILPFCSVEPAPPASLLGQGWAAAAQASLATARKPSCGDCVCPSLGGLSRKVYQITSWTQVTLDSFQVGCPGTQICFSISAHFQTRSVLMLFPISFSSLCLHSSVCK